MLAEAGSGPTSIGRWAPSSWICRRRKRLLAWRRRWAVVPRMPSATNRPAWGAAVFFADAPLDDHLLDVVGADRTFLVRGVTKKGPRPPYASLYANQSSGSSMFSLKATYRQAGFDLSTDAHEAPDYLGVELAFCAMLLDRAVRACESGEDTGTVAALVDRADDFVARHVLPLGCGYADEAISYAKTGYCRGMLHLLKEFLETEEALVKGEEAAVSAA